MRRKWLFSALALGMIGLTVTAGFWQLDRAEQKAALLAQLEPQGELQTLDAVRMHSGLQATRIRIPIDRVVLPAIFLENRIVDGRAGYEVFVRAETQELGLLVNAGWVPSERTRDDVPRIALTDVRSLVGRWVPMTGSYLSGDAAIEDLPNGRRAQSLLDVDFGAVQPGMILAEGWLPVTATGAQPRLGVETHLGYALQWFAMSLAIGIAWIWLMRSWGRRG